MSSLDYLDLCRLCLVKDRVSVPIFDGEGDVRQIFLKIAACLPVKVAREDKLPKKICDDCVYKVELFYQFWNTTANAEKQLLQWLGDVGLEEKQGYVTEVLTTEMMKQEQNERLDVSVLQTSEEHSNNITMNMMESINLGIPIIMSTDQEITVPISSSNNVQTVQSVAGPSLRSAHNQMSQKDGTHDGEGDTSEDDNTDDDCDADEGLPVKEENEDASGNQVIESTFVNVALACDEAGPSGLQQQKITEIPEMAIQQTSEGDSKSGLSPELPNSSNIRVINVRPNVRVVKRVIVRKMSDKDDYIVNYECKRCKVKYQGFYKDEKSKQFVKDHANHEDNECQRCSKAFHSIAQLMAHLRAAHGLKEYQCDICPFMTPFKKQIQVHKSTKHQVKERFLCKKCGTDLASYAKLVRHKCDDEKLPGLCQYCGYESKNKRTLRWHVRMYHTERPYTCPICNKNVVNEVGLILHMRFHENPRPKSEKFLCDNCGKKFKLKTALRNHMKTHTGEKSYSCSLCDRKFAKRETLRQHLLTHTGKRPYTCDICGKSFVQKPGLTSHRRSHPGKLPPMPRVSIDSYILEVDPSMVHAVKNPGPKLKTNTGNFLNRPEKSE